MGLISFGLLTGVALQVWVVFPWPNLDHIFVPSPSKGRVVSACEIALEMNAESASRSR